MSIPVESSTTKAQIYVAQKGWNHRESGDQINVEVCPVCGNSNWKFYLNRSTGLNDCKVCGWNGNLYKLMVELGDRVEGIQSMQETAQISTPPERMPNADALHAALLADGDALDYLVCERGYSMGVIQRYKLGLTKRFFPNKVGAEVPAIAIPYFHKNNLVYIKYRSLPPAEKDFIGTSGREQPLYNEDALVDGMDELTFVEGEADTLAMLSHGIETVVGVPGANIKKAAWIAKLDRVAPKKIYLLYDSDRVGQEAAHLMAKRIGIEKCFNLRLPEFETIDGKPGKDIAEWLRAGHTVEELEALKIAARPFDVAGVQSLVDTLDELERDLTEKGTLKPKYDSPWASLNRKFGGVSPSELIYLMADAKIGKTTFALNWVDYISEFFGEPCLVVCLEMPQKRLVLKWVSKVTKTDISPPKDADDEKEKNEALKLAIPQAKQIAIERKGDLVFGYASVKSADEVFDMITQAVRRYGVTWVVFDNLQLLCDTTIRNLAHRTTYLSQLSKRFRMLVNDLDIVGLVIVQPNRGKEGEILDSRNADGSSQIEKDCDSFLILHRSPKANMKAKDFADMQFLDVDDAFEPQMLVRVRLSRYAGGGACTLKFDGATSTVSEYLPGEGEAAGPVMQNSVPTESKIEA